MELVGLVTLITSFVITLLGVVLVKLFARRVYFVDEPGERKVHQAPIPLGGGIAIFLGVFLTLLLAVLAAAYLKLAQPSWLSPTIRDYIPGIFQMLRTLIVIFIGGFLITALGLLDDIRKLNPYLKLLGEILIIVFLILAGIRLSLFEPWGKYFAAAVTLIWMLVITNSFNLLDHMDGLSAGVAAVVSIIFLIAAFQTGQYFIACFLLAILGATLGFLIFNIHPASIFMGDAGSLLLGYLLAVLTVLFTFYEKEIYPSYSLFVPILVMAVPLFDTISVIIIRLKQHRPLFKGDMNHLAHRLTGLGMGPRAAVFTIYLLTLGTGLPAVLLYLIRKDLAIAAGPIILFQVILILVIITLLENAGRKSRTP